MDKQARGILVALGLFVLVWSGWHYFSAWSDNAKNAEYYRLYLAGRLTNVSSRPSREVMIDAKLSLDRARFVTGVTGAVGLALIGAGWLVPHQSTRAASRWSDSITRYLTHRRPTTSAGPKTDSNREAFVASFWLGCLVIPIVGLGWFWKLDVPWLMTVVAAFLGLGLWAATSSLCQGLGLPAWQVGGTAFLAFLPGVNLLVYIALSIASRKQWGPFRAWKTTVRKERSGAGTGDVGGT